jgi:hypothetical protein
VMSCLALTVSMMPSRVPASLQVQQQVQRQDP